MSAVKVQAWVALPVYVQVAIADKQLGVDLASTKFLQLLSVTAFEKTVILEKFSKLRGRVPERRVMYAIETIRLIVG